MRRQHVGLSSERSVEVHLVNNADILCVEVVLADMPER